MYDDQDAINELNKLNKEQEKNNSNENTTLIMNISNVTKSEKTTEDTSSSSSSTYESDDTSDSEYDIAIIHVTRVYRSRKAIANEDFSYFYIDDESKSNDGHFRLQLDDVESDILTGIAKICFYFCF